MPEIVKCMMNEFAASVNNPNKAHSSPLMASAMRGFDEIVKFLIERGANINQRTKNLDSPLSLAVWKNCASTARILIEAGANVTGIDRFGDSMLHDAAKNGNSDLVKYFLTKEIDINHQNNEGFAPIHRAAEFGHAAVILILQQAKANINLRDNKGKLPDDLAKNVEVIGLLRSAREAEHKEAKQAALIQKITAAASSTGGNTNAHVFALIALELVDALNRQSEQIAKLSDVVAHLQVSAAPSKETPSSTTAAPKILSPTTTPGSPAPPK